VKFNETDIVNVVIAGTAGQGVISLKRLVEYAAQKAGIENILGAAEKSIHRPKKKSSITINLLW